MIDFKNELNGGAGLHVVVCKSCEENQCQMCKIYDDIHREKAASRSDTMYSVAKLHMLFSEILRE